MNDAKRKCSGCKKNKILGVVLLGTLLGLNIILAMSIFDSQAMHISIKNTVIALYYFVYLFLELWNGFLILFLFLTSVVLGYICPIKLQDNQNYILSLGITSFVSLYLPLLFWVYRFETIPNGQYRNIIYAEYVILVIVLGFFVSIYLKDNMDIWTEKINLIERKNGNKIGISVVWGLIILTILPIISVGRYAFPQSDDFSFGYHCHLAWRNTHSLLQVFKAAITMVLEAYFGWQGSFSSIFLMSMQPTVFGKNLYFIVPYIMIFSLLISTCFLFKTIMADYLKVNHSWIIIWGSYLILVLQYMPSKSSAFFWFNGACHYILAFSMAVIMFTFLFRVIFLPHSFSNLIGGVLSALYVGGTNYVTTINMLFVVLSIMAANFVLKKVKNKLYSWIIIFCYLFSFTLNIIAPGNFMKMNNVMQSKGIFRSMLEAFYYASKYSLDKFLHWSIILYLVFLLPLFWVCFRKIEYNFQKPLLVVLYSWCFLASAYFMPIFTINNVEIGRFQNVIYCTWIICITVDMAYFIGWWQRRNSLRMLTIKYNFLKSYYIVLMLLGIVFSILTFAAETQKNTTFYSLKALQDSNVKLCYDIYSYDVDVMENAKDNTAIIYDLKNPSELFVDPTIEKWTSGLRIFFDIENLEVLPYNGENIDYNL